MEPHEEKIRTLMTIDAPREAIIAFRRLLFLNGISMQELFSHVMRLSEFNNKLVISLVDSCKKAKLEENTKERVHTNANSIYNLLEKKTPFKSSERLEDDNESVK